MRKLRIAQVAPLWYETPPKKYGGVERIVSLLTEGLVARGHKITLFAPPKSKTRAKLVSVYPTPLIKAGKSWDNPRWNLRNLSLATEMANNGHFDIVHAHINLFPLLFQSLTKTPFVTTLHAGVYPHKDAADYYRSRYELFKKLKNQTRVAFISQAMKRLAGFSMKQGMVIHNGIQIKDFQFNPKPKDCFIWIGRLEKKKGIENAISFAESLNIKLLIAGRISPDAKSQEYFNKKIAPRLGRRIQYLGEITQRQLSSFYGNAKALLYPIEWEEPFGLVMTESLACGTPVIAYGLGAVGEIVKHRHTGFVIKPNDKKTFAKAIRNIDAINRETCRERALKHFSASLMVDRYEAMYQNMLKR